MILNDAEYVLINGSMPECIILNNEVVWPTRTANYSALFAIDSMITASASAYNRHSQFISSSVISDGAVVEAPYKASVFVNYETPEYYRPSALFTGSASSNQYSINQGQKTAYSVVFLDQNATAQLLSVRNNFTAIMDIVHPTGSAAYASSITGNSGVINPYYIYDIAWGYNSSHNSSVLSSLNYEVVNGNATTSYPFNGFYNSRILDVSAHVSARFFASSNYSSNMPPAVQPVPKFFYSISIQGEEAYSASNVNLSGSSGFSLTGNLTASSAWLGSDDSSLAKANTTIHADINSIHSYSRISYTSRCRVVTGSATVTGIAP